MKMFLKKKEKKKYLWLKRNQATLQHLWNIFFKSYSKNLTKKNKSGYMQVSCDIQEPKAKQTAMFLQRLQF